MPRLAQEASTERILVLARSGSSELVAALATRGREIVIASDQQAGLAQARAGPQLVVVEDEPPRIDGVELVRLLRTEGVAAPVLILASEATVAGAVEAMRAGALDFLQRPFDPELLRARVAQAIGLGQAARELETLRRKVQRRRKADLIIGVSPAVDEVRRIIGSVARTEVAVALFGETGTGKELAARTIHEQSERSDKPFVVVDCTALPEALLENELFGHEAGAYTGADRRTPGLLAEADGGTLFIDEIGEMPLALQSKLLRFLQTKEFRRVGGTGQQHVDVRVITATNRNLEAEVAAGRFRQDLFYRINVFPLRLPPLRERPEDIALLADHFARSFAKELGRPVESFLPEALAVLSDHGWPGNVRQLENVVRRLVVVAEGARIQAEACRVVLGSVARSSSAAPEALRPFHEARAAALERFERAYLQELLRGSTNNLAEAARRAGIDRKNLWLKLKRYGLGRTPAA
jgi:two-component system response regulator HydG